jgi:hypothetical protein
MKPLLLTLPLLLLACGEPFSNATFEADLDYLQAAPTAAQIRLGGPSADLSGVFIVTEPAEFYVYTRQAMLSLNGTAFRLLRDVDRLLESAPTTRGADHRIWLPEAHPLDPLEHQFEMRRTEDGFDYVLSQRPHGAQSAHLPTLFGHVVPSLDGGPTTGHLTLDFDASARVTGTPTAGQLHVAYTFDGGTTHLELVFDGFDYGAGPLDAVYRFERTPDGAGWFDYGAPTEDLDWVDVRARWTPTGAGRVDLRAIDGETSAHLSECWGTDFGSAWTKFGIQETGDRDACAFPEASWPESTQVE